MDKMSMKALLQPQQFLESSASAYTPCKLYDCEGRIVCAKLDTAAEQECIFIMVHR